MLTFELPAQVFLQLAVILGAIRLVGVLVARVGQPHVIGEMVAGVVLGPSLLGWAFPGVQAALFPESSLPTLHVLSQLGLVLYMFLIGLEFDLEAFGRRIPRVAAISIGGIAGPFLLSTALTGSLYGMPGLFAPGIPRWEAMLFMGAAMSITAFPVLARIIQDRGLAGTPLGTLALAGGAVNDAAAWCIFAVVLANFSGDARVALVAIGGGAAYVAAVTVARRTVVARLGAAVERAGRLKGPQLSLVLVMLMLSAWFTEAIGIHAVFGAFLLGGALPRGVLTRELQRQFQPLAATFLVPLFFVSSGLHTQLALVVTPELWGIALLVIVVACAGKGGGCWLAARLSGETHRDALALGTLMNARGLMELILLNIALERGIITPTLFAIMVVMAVGTTLMASPLFELLYRPSRATPEVADVQVAVKV